MNAQPLHHRRSHYDALAAMTAYDHCPVCLSVEVYCQGFLTGEGYRFGCIECGHKWGFIPQREKS